MKYIRFICCLLVLIFALSACASGKESSAPAKSDDRVESSSPTTPPSSVESEASEKSDQQIASSPFPSASAENTPTSDSSASLAPSNDPLSEDEQFLAGVTYRHYELTGESTPYFVGRWYKQTLYNYRHMVTTNSGSMLYFMVKDAPTMEVNFTLITDNEVPYYAYSIDGGTPVRRSITEPTVKLPDTGRHTVRIITEGIHEHVGKWSEEKGYAFKNIELPEGGEILGIKPKEKIVFFYGDSITEGINAIGASGYGDSHSATNAYPWYCSEKLGVTLYNIGYGATGLINTGSFNTMLAAIDRMTNKRLVSMDITPDVIVINHGHNDQYYGELQMKSALQKTMNRLRKKYPDVPIVYMIPFNQAHAALITEFMSTIENSYVIQTKGWNLSMTEGVHPNPAGAKKAGEKLADEMLNIFGEDYFKEYPN